MHSFNVKVYYEDTDLAGIVYYANYLKFIERARSEAVADAGIDQLTMQSEHGIVFVVRHLEAEFLQSAKFGDLLEIRTDITEMSGARIVMRQQISHETKGIFAANVTLAVMSTTGRAVRLPADIRQKLQHLVS